MAKIAAAKADEADEWDGLADETLTRLLGFHLRMANLAMYRDFTAAIGDLDLTQKQAAILSLIGANPGIAQVAIAARLGADRATIMAMVDRLDARGLLKRERSKEDRRRQDLFLTPLGKTTLNDAQARIAAHEARFSNLFSKAELRALFDALRRIQSLNGY